MVSRYRPTTYYLIHVYHAFGLDLGGGAVVVSALEPVALRVADSVSQQMSKTCEVPVATESVVAMLASVGAVCAEISDIAIGAVRSNWTILTE